MELRKIVKQKKGDIFQVIFLIAILLVTAITGLICLVITTRINDFWDSSGLLNETQTGIDAIDTMQETAPRTTDYTILFLSF